MALWVVVACALFALQLFISSPATTTWPMARRVGILIAQGVVTYLPLLVLGKEWGGMAGFFAGSILLLVPGATAWALFGAVIATTVVVPLSTGLPRLDAAYLAASSLGIGLTIFGLSRLSLVISYLKANRAHLAQLAVLHERERFARDLHDLLGYSLSAITLKAELTKRLVAVDPDRARDEFADLLEIARQALADVRLVASGYRNMSLAKEAATITSLLSVAGIAATVDVDCGALAEDVDSMLATVLREAVTNMLRHSTAQACTIEARRTGPEIVLHVSNDGAPDEAASNRAGGGLENLAMRLASMGGRITATARDRKFELTAVVPAAGPAAAGVVPAPRLPGAAQGPGEAGPALEAHAGTESGDRKEGGASKRAEITHTVRILLAEDVPMIRGALVALIELDPSLIVVASVDNGARIFPEALSCHPDVAIIDIDLPGLDGLSAAEQLHQELPDCRTLILTHLAPAGNLRRVLAANVHGYILKDAPAEQLAAAIRAVAAGRRFIDPQVAMAAWESRENPLSPREHEVLRLAAQGAEPAEIASALHLSVGTVRNYLTTIVVKLNARNRVDAIKSAWDAGWLP
jgi:two-component system sensor histidine kinase DesK